MRKIPFNLFEGFLLLGLTAVFGYSAREASLKHRDVIDSFVAKSKESTNRQVASIGGDREIPVANSNMDSSAAIESTGIQRSEGTTGENQPFDLYKENSQIK